MKPTHEELLELWQDLSSLYEITDPRMLARAVAIGHVEARRAVRLAEALAAEKKEARELRKQLLHFLEQQERLEQEEVQLAEALKPRIGELRQSMLDRACQRSALVGRIFKHPERILDELRDYSEQPYGVYEPFTSDLKPVRE